MPDRPVRRYRAIAAFTLLVIVITSPAMAGPGSTSRPRRVSGPSPFGPDGCGVSTGAQGGEFDTSIAVNPRNPANIVTAWIQDEALGVVVASSRDGGRTWRRSTPRGFTTCTGGEAERAFHPRLSFGPDGVVYLSALVQTGFFGDPVGTAQVLLTDRIPVSRSVDGGQTWSEPTFVDEPMDAGIDFDTITAEPDVRGAIDVVWNPDEITFVVPQTVNLSRSTDAGRTWTTHRVGSSTPGTISGERVVALRDGTLLVAYTEVNPVYPVLGVAGLAPPGANGPLRVVRSEDKGETWSAPVTVAETSTFGWPGGVAGAGGAAVLSWYAPGEEGQQLFVSRTGDSGRTWSPPSPVAPVPVGAPDPEIAVTPDGAIGVLFYDFRNDREGDEERTVDVWFRHSHDGGRTWRESHLGGPFDLSQIPDQSLHLVEGLAGSKRGFVAAFIQGPPQAVHGPTDVFVAGVRIQPRR